MSAEPPETARAEIIGSQREFADALLRAMHAAMQRRCRLMLCFDADFGAWPLDDAGLLEALTRWLRLPQRQLILVADDFDGFAAGHPRFAGWYRNWSHAVFARTPTAQSGIELPCLFLADSGEFVDLSDPLHWRGRSGFDVRQVRHWRSQHDALLQQCQPTLPVTTLGL